MTLCLGVQGEEGDRCQGDGGRTTDAVVAGAVVVGEEAERKVLAATDAANITRVNLWLRPAFNSVLMRQIQLPESL